jgi:hypothetical protein
VNSDSRSYRNCGARFSGSGIDVSRPLSSAYGVS